MAAPVLAAAPASPPVPTVNAIKREARRLRDQRRAQGRRVKLTALYDELAQAAGFASWAAFRQAIRTERTP